MCDVSINKIRKIERIFVDKDEWMELIYPVSLCNTEQED